MDVPSVTHGTTGTKDADTIAEGSTVVSTALGRIQPTAARSTEVARHLTQQVHKRTISEGAKTWESPHSQVSGKHRRAPSSRVAANTMEKNMQEGLRWENTGSHKNG